MGLIFAQMGLASGVFDAGLFSAVTLVVMVTTFMAVGGQPPPQSEGIEDLCTEA